MNNSENKDIELYQDRDPGELGEFYQRHYRALAAEGVLPDRVTRTRSFIAAELAYRDKAMHDLARALNSIAKECLK